MAYDGRRRTLLHLPVPAGPSRRGAGRRAGCFAVWSFLCGVFLFSYQRTGRHSAGGTARTLRCLTCPRTLAVHPRYQSAGGGNGGERASPIGPPQPRDWQWAREPVGLPDIPIAPKLPRGALAAAELAVPARFWPSVKPWLTVTEGDEPRVPPEGICTSARLAQAQEAVKNRESQFPAPPRPRLFPARPSPRPYQHP